MPGPTFETGATFTIADQFSEPLRRLLGGLTDAGAAVTKLQEQINGIGLSFDRSSKAAIGSMSALNADILEKSKAWGSAFDSSFAGLGKSAEVGANGAIAALGRMDSAITASMARIGSMVAEFERLNTGAGAALAAGGMGGASLAQRRGSHGGGLHFGRVGGSLGGVHASITGNAGLAAGLIALDGIYQAGEIDELVAKSLATGQINISAGVSQSAAGQRIHDMIQNAAKTTGYSFHDTGESILDGQRLLSQMPFDERNKLIERIIPFAATEAKLKGSGLSEAVEAIISIAHQTQTYDPGGIEKMAKSLAYTSLLTPSDLPQFKNTLGYSMPQLYNGLNMDPSTIMLLTATMQQSGIGSTKAGTWLRSFFEQSEPGSDEHNDALRKLGMLDASNKPSWRKTAADGKVDWESSIATLSGILQYDATSIPIDDRLSLLRKAYGERGAGFASLMMGQRFTENLTSAQKNMATFKGGDDFLAQFGSASVLQQGRQALQEFNVAISDLGTKLMPTATQAVRDFSDLMKSFNGGWRGVFGEIWEKAIKPDLGPLGRLNTSPPSDADRPPPVDMTDPRRLPPGVQLNAFETFAGGRDGPLADAIAGGFLKAFRELQGGASGVPNVSGSGGFTNASFTTFGSTGVGSSGGNFLPGAPGAAVDTAMRLQGLGSGGAAQALGAHMTNGEWCADFVNGALSAHGIKGSGSSAALSFSHWGTAVGVNAARKGDVAFENHGGGHGHAMLLTGEHDSRGWLGVVAGNSGGRVKKYWENPAKLGGIRRAIPSVGAPPRHHQAIQVTAELHVDGERMASNVSHHMARGMEFPAGMGVDNYGSWQGPATPLTDAA